VVPETVPPFDGDVIDTRGGVLSTVRDMDELAALLNASVASTSSVWEPSLAVLVFQEKVYGEEDAEPKREPSR
jgi:hypothetical protein